MSGHWACGQRQQICNFKALPVLCALKFSTTTPDLQAQAQVQDLVGRKEKKRWQFQKQERRVATGTVSSPNEQCLGEGAGSFAFEN